MAQTVLPNADVSDGAWSATGGDGNLFESINETSGGANDADFIGTTTGGDTCTVGLATGTDPVSSASHTIRYRAKGASGLGTEQLTVELLQGAGVIATDAERTLTASFQDFSVTISGAEADSITDYSALRFRFTETGPGLGKGDTVVISQASFEYPDAPTGNGMPPSQICMMGAGIN